MKRENASSLNKNIFVFKVFFQRLPVLQNETIKSDT